MNDSSVHFKQFSLLRKKRFLPFFLTQFFGAFNDNVFKNALIIMIAFSGSLATEEDINTMTNLSAGLFILPFFLFSAVAGQLIDKYEKSACIRWIKCFEILIMISAAIAFYLQSIYLLITILFVLGAQSTLFGPAKYSYIPQHLSKNELVAGNALVQSGTFIAILMGTMIGGLLVGTYENSMLLAIFLVVIAMAGFISSLFIPETPSLIPQLNINWNPVTESWKNIRYLLHQRSILMIVLGISWFWFLGSTYLVQLPNYTRTILGGNEQVVTLLLTVFAISVGGGALLCNRLSRGKIEIGLVPLGSIGITLFGIDLSIAQPLYDVNQLSGVSDFIRQADNIRVIVDIAFIGIFSGLYIVPLFASVQYRSDPSYLSRIIAGNNILNAIFMVIAAIMAIVLLGSGLSIAQLFLITAILNIAFSLFLFSSEPEFVLRLFKWFRKA